MLISEMIVELLNVMKEIGDREVLISDGVRDVNYRGNYSIGIFEDVDGCSYADIGIGFSKEHDNETVDN